jgi:hypothetical protein
MIDKLVRMDGFADAMEAARWLVVSDDGITFPNYEEHNGPTAKARAVDAKRKGKTRKTDKCPESVRKVSDFCPENTGQNPDKLRTEVGTDKIREDKSRKDIVDHKCKEGVVGGDFELAINADDKPEFGELPDAFRSTWPETFRVSVWDLAKRKFEWIKSLPGYSQADAATLLKIAACEACGQISEYFVDDACEGLRRARESPRNPVGYLYTTLQRAMLEKKGVKLENIIGRVKLPTK